jgi:hypothetical protein
MKVRVISDKFSPFSKGEIINHKDNVHLKKIIAMGKVELVEEGKGEKKPKKDKKDTSKNQTK